MEDWARIIRVIYGETTVSLFLYPRKDSQFWWVGGKVYLGNKYITVRQSTKCIAKRDAKEELRNIETKALARLKGNGTPSVPFSNSVIKWTKLQKRSDGDLWNAQLLLRFFRDRDIYAITLDDWQRCTIKHLKNYKPSSSILVKILGHCLCIPRIQKRRVVVITTYRYKLWRRLDLFTYVDNQIRTQ